MFVFPRLTEIESQIKALQAEAEKVFDITPTKPKKFRVGDLVKVVGELHQGQVGRIVNIELSLFKVRKTAKQSEIFSELHNTRFADLLVKHIESTGDRSDFDWIPNRLKKQVESRIVNVPEQLTMLIA